MRCRTAPPHGQGRAHRLNVRARAGDEGAYRPRGRNGVRKGRTHRVAVADLRVDQHGQRMWRNAHSDANNSIFAEGGYKDWDLAGIWQRDQAGRHGGNDRGPGSIGGQSGSTAARKAAASLKVPEPIMLGIVPPNFDDRNGLLTCRFGACRLCKASPTSRHGRQTWRRHSDRRRASGHLVERRSVSGDCADGGGRPVHFGPGGGRRVCPPPVGVAG